MQNGDVYRSKVGAFYIIMILVLIAIGAYLTYFAYSKGDMSSAAISAALTASAPLFLAYIHRRTRYIFREHSLQIRTWMARYDIEYSYITHVEEMSGPFTVHTMPVVFSSDLIMIRYDKRGMVHISPARKEEFLAKLISKLPPSACVKQDADKAEKK